jgi:hypothetical protein
MNTTTSSSAGYDLNTETTRVSVYVLPVLITFILITNIINICVLCRKSLRMSSCTYYFLVMAVASLVYLPFTPINMYLNIRFGLNIAFSAFGCRIVLFFTFTAALIFIVSLVCASADRYCASSSSVRLRRFSNPRVAYRIIIVATLLIMIYLIPFLIINHWDDSTKRCAQYSNTLIVVYLSSRVVLHYILGPLMMAIFGMLTIQNIRSQGRRMQPVSHQGRRRRTEGQLSRMLIIQVGTYLLFSLPVCVTYILVTFLPSIVTPLVSGIRAITIFWQLGAFFVSFFLYILSADIYRTELKKMLHLNGNQARVIPTNSHSLLQMQAINTTATRTQFHHN